MSTLFNIIPVCFYWILWMRWEEIIIRIQIFTLNNVAFSILILCKLGLFVASSLRSLFPCAATKVPTCFHAASEGWQTAHVTWKKNLSRILLNSFFLEKKKKKAKKSQKTLTNISCPDPLLVEISNFHQFQPVILCSVRQTIEVLLSCFHFSFIPCFCLSVLLHFFWSLLPCILPSFLRSPLPCPPLPGVWFCSCSSSSIPAPASS